MNWAVKCVWAALTHMQHPIALTRGLCTHDLTVCMFLDNKKRFAAATTSDTNSGGSEKRLALVGSFCGQVWWRVALAFSCGARGSHWCKSVWWCGGTRRRLFICQLAVWWAGVIVHVNKHSGNVHDPTGVQALGVRLAGFFVHVYTDSKVTLYSIRKVRMDTDIGMDIIREIHLLLVTYDICLDLKRITLKIIHLQIDALSRMDNVKFAYHAFSMLLDPDLHSCQVTFCPLIHMTLQSWFYLL